MSAKYAAVLDVLLGYFRGVLVYCATIADCERWMLLSENNMMLAIAGLYLSIACVRISISYFGQRRAQEQQPQKLKKPQPYTRRDIGLLAVWCHE